MHSFFTLILSLQQTTKTIPELVRCNPRTLASDIVVGTANDNVKILYTMLKTLESDLPTLSKLLHLGANEIPSRAEKLIEIVRRLFLDEVFVQFPQIDQDLFFIDPSWNVVLLRGTGTSEANGARIGASFCRGPEPSVYP